MGDMIITNTNTDTVSTFGSLQMWCNTESCPRRMWTHLDLEYVNYCYHDYIFCVVKHTG